MKDHGPENDPGQVSSAIFGLGLENFRLKSQIFQFFPFHSGQKKYLWVGSKSTRVKDGSASYLLRVKSMLRLGQGPSLPETIKAGWFVALKMVTNGHPKSKSGFFLWVKGTRNHPFWKLSFSTQSVAWGSSRFQAVMIDSFLLRNWFF